jgi:glycosidase
LSEFGGSGWEFDEVSGQYYYHAFLRSQPDLNWRNPEVVDAMRDVLRFWLRKGIDGFRVDVIWHLVKFGHPPFGKARPRSTTAMNWECVRLTFPVTACATRSSATSLVSA